MRYNRRVLLVLEKRKAVDVWVLSYCDLQQCGQVCDWPLGRRSWPLLSIYSYCRCAAADARFRSGVHLCVVLHVFVDVLLCILDICSHMSRQCIRLRSCSNKSLFSMFIRLLWLTKSVCDGCVLCLWWFQKDFRVMIKNYPQQKCECESHPRTSSTPFSHQ